VKCPHCKEDIDHLFFEEERTYSGAFTLDDGYEDSSCGDGYTHFSCPECGQMIADCETEARQFLEGNYEYDEEDDV
jgi:phage FluMu protein Com